MQVVLQPVQEQARKNKEAIAAAGHAGRKADQLGTDNASSKAQQLRKEVSLNTDTRHKFANASLAPQQHSPEKHASSDLHSSADGAKPQEDGSSKQTEAPPASAAAAEGISRVVRQKGRRQEGESQQSPSRDKRGREESKAERKSKALRTSLDGPCSPQGHVSVPAGHAADVAQDADDNPEQAANLAARLLGNSWLRDMKGRFDEALGRGPRGDAGGASEGSRDERKRPTVALVDRALFERILFSFDTMPHHLPDTYLSAVQQL